MPDERGFIPLLLLLSSFFPSEFFFFDDGVKEREREDEEKKRVDEPLSCFTALSLEKKESKREGERKGKKHPSRLFFLPIFFYYVIFSQQVGCKVAQVAFPIDSAPCYTHERVGNPQRREKKKPIGSVLLLTVVSQTTFGRNQQAYGRQVVKEREREKKTPDEMEKKEGENKK